MVSEFPNVYAVAGYRVLDGYAALIPAKALDYRLLQSLRLAQAEYVHKDVKEDAGISGLKRWSRVWYRVPDPLPRVRLVSRTQVSDKPERDVQQIDIEHVALVTHPIDLDAVATGTAEIVTDDPGEMRVRIRSSGRQLLVVSESFDEGWIAAADGQPAPVERVNGDFLGCVVGPGDHVVSLQFRPAHLVWGRSVSVGGFLVALVLMAIGAQRSRATRAPAPE